MTESVDLKRKIFLLPTALPTLHVQNSRSSDALHKMEGKQLVQELLDTQPVVCTAVELMEVEISTATAIEPTSETVATTKSILTKIDTTATANTGAQTSNPTNQSIGTQTSDPRYKDALK